MANMMQLNPSWAIGLRCRFCHTKFTDRDLRHTNIMINDQYDLLSHSDCLQFVISKYPHTALSALDGHLSRVRVELSNVHK